MNNPSLNCDLPLQQLDITVTVSDPSPHILIGQRQASVRTSCSKSFIFILVITRSPRRLTSSTFGRMTSPSGGVSRNLES